MDGEKEPLNAWERDEEEEDEEELNESYWREVSKDTVVLAIDASSSMQELRVHDADESAGNYDSETENEDNDGEAGPRKKRKILTSNLEQAIIIATQFLKKKAFSNPHDKIAILLYNTSKRPLPGEYMPPGICFLPEQQVARVNVDRVRAMIEITDSASEDSSWLKGEYPPVEEDKKITTAALMRQCSATLTDANIKNGTRRIFLITDDDLPPGPIDKATISVRDIRELGADIVPFFIDSTDAQFDSTRYWDNVLENTDIAPKDNDDLDDNSFPIGSGLTRFKDLLQKMTGRAAVKRALYNVPLILADDLIIGVKGYGTVTAQRIPTSIFFSGEGEGYERVKAWTRYYDPEAAGDAQRYIPSDNIEQALVFGNKHEVPDWYEAELAASKQPDLYTTYGGSSEDETKPLLKVEKDVFMDGEVDDRATEGKDDQTKAASGSQPEASSIPGSKTRQSMRPPPRINKRVQFRPKELMEFKTLGYSPGIRVLGFLDKDFLKSEWNIKNASFIYPHEATYIGSTRVFAALLHTCNSRNQIALARCSFRKGGMPVICVLIPQIETLDENQVQIDAPGFHVIQIPYLDDWRDTPAKVAFPTKKANPEIVKIAEKLIRKIAQVNGHQPHQYSNPHIKLFQAEIESMAFDIVDDELEDKVRKEDNTLPDVGLIHSRAGDKMREWNQAIRDSAAAYEHVSKNEEFSESKAQSSRSTKASAEIDISAVYEYFISGHLNKLKVDTLKAFCRFNSLIVGGKKNKADLLAAVSEHFAKEE